MPSEGYEKNKNYNGFLRKYSDDAIIDLLLKLDDPFYALMGDSSIFDYFYEQRGIPIYSHSDLDDFKGYVEEEISRRDGGIEKKFATHLQSKKTLEALASSKTYAGSLDELDNLQDPLCRIIPLVYEDLKENHTVDVRIPLSELEESSIFDNYYLGHPKREIFFRRTKGYLLFGKDIFHIYDYFRGNRGFDLFLSERFGNPKIVSRIGTEMQHNYVSIDEGIQKMLKDLKVSLVHSNLQRNTLKTILNLPSILVQARERKRKEIDGSIGDIFSAISEE